MGSGHTKPSSVAPLIDQSKASNAVSLSSNVNASNLKQEEKAKSKEFVLTQFQKVFKQSEDLKEDFAGKNMNTEVRQNQNTSAMHQLMRDPTAAKAFRDFLENDSLQDHIEFFEEIELIKQAHQNHSNIESQNEAIASMTRDLIGSFTITNLPKSPSSDKETRSVDTLSMQMLSNESAPASSIKLLLALDKAQEEIVMILAMKAFPRFKESRQFQEWKDSKRAQIRGGDIPTQIDEIVTNTMSGMDMDSRKRIENPVQSPCLIGQEDFKFALKREGSWLGSLFKSSENLPVCVTVASASKSCPGFPLLHVNEMFESICGYTRYDIIGQNCRFLQTRQKGVYNGLDFEEDRCSPESIQLMTTALAAGKPLKLCVDNFRKDGTKFVNLLAMKPIYDDLGEYRFVVGVQFDVSSESSSASMFMLADILIRSIPDVICH